VTGTTRSSCGPAHPVQHEGGGEKARRGCGYFSFIVIIFAMEILRRGRREDMLLGNYFIVQLFFARPSS